MSTNQNNNGTCALCRTEDTALCESHIIPKFLYNLPEDQAVRNELRIWSSDRSKRPKRRPIGVYERLLCAQCEGRLRSLEDYAAVLLYGRDKKLTLGEHERDLAYVYTDVDYAKLKLFQISLLWRMSISQAEGFERVSLAEHHDAWRAMLLADSPGRYDAFGCAMSYCPLIRERLPEWDFETFAIFPEQLAAQWGYPMVQMFFGGIQWNFHVTPKVMEPIILSVFVNESGLLIIPKLGEQAYKFIIEDTGEAFDWVGDTKAE